MNVDGLLGRMGGAENTANAAVNGLGPGSTATDLQRAGFRVAEYQIVATLVSQVIKTDGDARTTSARSIGSR